MSRPFAGLRVVELSSLPGAYGGMLLAGLGAEVIKVEPPEGDPLRRLEPTLPGVAAPENSLWWAYLGQGRRSVVIEPTPSGAEQLKWLLTSADIVLDDAPIDHWDASGCGPDAIEAVNPKVIWVSITPFGRTGPHRDWKGSNLIAWAACGVLYTTGFPDRPPVVPAGPVQLAYHVAALNAVIGAQLALRLRRANDGQGQRVDISMQEALLAIAPETGAPISLDDRVHRPRTGNRRDVTRPFGLYPCADGFVSFLVLQPNHWQAFAAWIAEVTGIDALTDEAFADMIVRREAGEFVDSSTEALTMGMTKLELFQEAQRRGIPCTPVNTIGDLRVDPHLAASGFFETVEHPAIGSYTRPGPPFRDNHGWWSLERAPLLGEHTAAILGS